MPKFCFNWSLSGSTMIEADSLAEAQAKFDKVETNTDILASADRVDFDQGNILVETEAGVFEGVDDRPEPDPGSDDPNCVHEWANTGTAYGGDDERWMGEGRAYCIHCGADGDA